ncbi:MAG: DUF3576 domain-containing protein [Pseudomonadota bacterium]
MKTIRTILPFFSVLIAFTLSACGGDGTGGIQTEARYPTGAERDGVDANDIYSEPESIFGEEGLIFGSRRKDDNEDGASGIAVNSFLWRASLDTVSFMPLASADPFGGVILTDWYSPEENANERFKINVFILSKQLRSDAIQVRLFKQVRSGGTWRDTKPSAETVRQLEDSILTRARQLRVAQLGD